MNTRSRTSRRALVAAAVSAPAVLVPLAVAVPASAAVPARPHPRPPVVRVEPTWQFVVGSAVDRTTSRPLYPADTRVFHRQVPVQLAWQGYAARGTRITGYDLGRYNDRTGRLMPLLRMSRDTSYTVMHTDIAYPPGYRIDGLHPLFRLAAHDSAGGVTVVDRIQRHPVFSEQENGTTYQNGRTVFPSAPRPDRGWYRKAGPAYDAGTVLVARSRGATVRIPVHAHRGGQWVALEMTTGPRLGRAEVRLDGHLLGTVDTAARTTRERVLVAQYLVSAGNHTLTLTNLGAGYRSTIELDGVFASD